MDIRKKTVVIVCITLLCLILALYISSEVIVLGGFSRVETQNAQKETNRVLVALGNDINALDAVTYDWASRGDTIAFVTANISGTEWSRLDTDTFERLGFNEILLYNASGSLVSGQGYDLNRHTLVPVPPDLHSPPSVYPHLKFQNGSSTGIMGIADSPDGPMMIAIRPVFAGRENQHVAGYVLMGRYIDTTEISRLSSLAQLPLEMHGYSDRDLPQDFITILPMFPASSIPFIQRVGKDALTIDAPIIVEPINSTQLGGYSLIRDISGKPVLIIKVGIDRGIYDQGKSTTLYFVVLLIIAGLVFGLTTLLLLEKTVLSRLERLSQGVNEIGRKRDFSARVHIAGEDEIGGLAGRVNGMLEDLEQSQNVLHDKLIQSEENYRLFFNSVTDPICVCRMNPDNSLGRIVEVNDAACEVLGYQRAEFLEMHLSDLLPGEKSGGVDLPTKILQSFGHVIYAGAVSTKTGKRIPVEVNARTFDQFGHPAIAVIVRDISEREEIEHLKKEAFQQIEKNLQDFAVLNDHIRNPLQGIVGIADMMDGAPAQKIITYATMIDEIVNRIDRGYIESEKIHEFLRKYYGIGKK